MRNVLILLLLSGLVHATRSFRPHAGDTDDVASVALAFGFLLLASYHAGRLFSAARLPKIVAYIITGLVAGPHVLALVPEPVLESLGLVNNVAVCLIALTAGAELSLERIRPLLGSIARITGAAVVGTAVVLTGALYALSPMLPFLGALEPAARLAVSGMLGVALAAQSPAVVMALVSETCADGPLTRTVLGVVVIADLVVIVLFGVASSFAQAATGGAAAPLDTALEILWELFGSVGAGVFVGVLLALYLRHITQGVSLFVLILCVVVAEVGRRLHLDPLIVMLAAGAWVENVVRAEASGLVRDIEAASLPVYLVFFALAGASLHLDVLASLAIPALILVVARAAGFRALTAVATRGAGTDDVVRRWAWAGLLPQAGLALALALVVARQFPALEEASGLILAVIAVNELVMPIVLRHAFVASGEAGQREAPEFAGEPSGEIPLAAVEAARVPVTVVPPPPDRGPTGGAGPSGGGDREG